MASWTVPTPQELAGPLTGSDRPMLEAYLAWRRATPHNICAGLSGAQPALRPVAFSTLSLQGLLRHRAKDHDSEATDPARAAEDLDLWSSASRLAVEIVASFDHAFLDHGEPMSLRLVHVHMIGEYARHNGHADLLRQAIDGVTAR